MIFDNSPPKRRFFVPETVQTSAMDCGPAALKCMLEGFGIPVSYGRLREACQTDIDGTSIDVMEDVAVQLGLDAEQVMVPSDHLFIPETLMLPAIVIVRLPDGLTHFVVAWRLHGGFVQIMDPSLGRRWLSLRRFICDLYIHTHSVPAADWRDWAGSEGFCDPLHYRMSDLGAEESLIVRLTDSAKSDPGWYSLAALDAAVRMTGTLVRSEGIRYGREAVRVLESFFTEAVQNPERGSDILPLQFWSVHSPPDKPLTECETLILKGAVLVRVSGLLSDTAPEETGIKREPLSPELAAALKEKPSSPELEILRFLREDGLTVPGILILSLLMSVMGVTVEAMLFRGLIDIGQSLNPVSQRIGAFAGLFIFALGLLLLEFPVASAISRMGRRLEIRMRIAFLRKIPRLGDQYFRSRLISDMTQRVHAIRSVRTLPGLGFAFIRTCLQMILTTGVIIFLIPGSALIPVLATTISIGISLVFQPVLTEQDLRISTHIGAMSRFYLDALLGLIPIRTHCAERAVRRQHESLLTEWVRTNMDFLSVQTVVMGIEASAGAILAIWIVFDYLHQGGGDAGALLVFYWSLSLPSLGKQLAGFAQQYPMLRNRILRLLEPIGASEEIETQCSQANPCSQAPAWEQGLSCKGIAVDLKNVTVRAGGQTILKDITVSLQSGEHIAVVGPSGAGKSSLAGLFLGWHRAASGTVRTDGELLKGTRLQALRKETVWADPEVYVWNRSLLENLCYGTDHADISSVSYILEKADLSGVLEKLPDGLQTRLGEGGRLLSGGEGQRIRLGRGMLRPGARLVILDEPFRGLDRGKRREMLIRARQHWQDATLIFISHDVEQALTFDRVLVIADGEIKEDGKPQTLADNPDSRYCALLKSDHEVRKGLWENSEWRRLRLENGQLSEGKSL